MNVFYTSKNPITAARELCYVHRRKMIVEYAQILSTAHHICDGRDVKRGLYRQTHINHPSVRWASESDKHYRWVHRSAMELCKLYLKQTGREHKTYSTLLALAEYPKRITTNRIFESPPIAAPDEFKDILKYKSVTVAYQAYLRSKYIEWGTRDRIVKVEFDKKPTWFF